MAAGLPTQDPAPAEGPSGSRGSRDWLFGPAADLVLGCGLGSVAVLGLLSTGASLAAVVPGAVLVLVFSLPHYGATLLRVYALPEDRTKYRLFAIHASLLLACLFVAALHSPLLGSVVLTVYLTWSPWHYTGQNYGIFLMLLGRRGVDVDSPLKRLVYASFVLSYALTFLALHGVEPGATYAPVQYKGSVFAPIPLGISAPVASWLLVCVGAAYAGSVAGSIALLVRRGSLRALAPSLALMGTQALWFSVPVLVRYASGGESAIAGGAYTAYAFLWIAAGHAVQYLWITTYYAVGSRPAREKLGYLAKATLAGYAIWTLPALLFAPGLLGRLPHESGLALMVAAVVNLHHFVLDGVIWKLRDGRVARILLRAEPDRSTPGRGWVAPAVWVAGGLCMVVGIGAHLEAQYGFARALTRGDLERAIESNERLRWLGRESPTRYLNLGRRLAGEAQLARANEYFERSLALQPTARAWESIARLHVQMGRWSQALQACQEALALSPDDPNLLYQTGLVLLRLDRPGEAETLFARALARAPGEPTIDASLRRARRRAAEPTDASGVPGAVRGAEETGR